GQQDDLRRDARHEASRIEAEEAEVDLDVAVGGLQTAERQNAFPRGAELRPIGRQAGELKRGVRLDGRADFAGAAGIDTEAAIGELAFHDAARGPIDARAAGWIPVRAA